MSVDFKVFSSDGAKGIRLRDVIQTSYSSLNSSAVHNRFETMKKKVHTNGQSKQDYIWNTIVGLINAAEAVIMSMYEQINSIQL